MESLKDARRVDWPAVTAKAPVVAVVDGGGIQAAVSLMRQGAAAVVDLREGVGNLAPAIQESIRLWSERGRLDSSAREAKERMARLKKPERDVVDLIMRGYRNCAIARALNVSQRTVEARRAKAMRILNAATPVEFAYRLLLAELGGCGLVAPDPFFGVQKQWFSDAAS